jgi:2-hydroxychromene-2-carboxylate isomerase
MREADLHFYFDPVCPFAWLTSTWVRQVMAARNYRVEWRLVSLRLMNAHIDYDSHFPPEYEAGHTAGLRMLRVAARTRAEHGPEALDPLQAAIGLAIFDRDPWPEGFPLGEPEREQQTARQILAEAGLPLELAEALSDDGWDAAIKEETDAALALTGRDVGTPIIHVDPPHGPAFFGPVISRRPTDAEAGELWDHVVALARFPGFSEFKRSLREQPQLRAFGVGEGDVGVVEDWHAGSRRLKH